MRNLTVILSLLFTVHSGYGQYVWTQKTSMPIGRYIASSFSIGNQEYVGTGYNSNATALSDWWKYDPLTESWSQVASNSGPRSSATTFVIDGKGYVCLGATSSIFLTDIYEYNPLNNAWTQKASLPAQGRFGAAGFTIGNTGYVCCGNFGSSTGPYTNEVFGYDALTDTWSPKAAFPGMVRYGGRGESINNLGYVFGGINGIGNSSSYFFTDLWEYDPALDNWTQKADIPGLGRNYASTFVLDGKFVAGNGIHWTGFLNDFYAFDPLTNSWSNLPSLPANASRWAAVGFSLGSDGYVATGNQSFNNPIVISDELWKLSLTTSLAESGVNDQLEFVVSPTLASDHINILFSKTEFRSYRLILRNVKGQVCSNIMLSGGNTEISTLNLSDGLYLAFVTDEHNNEIAVEKFIVNHN